MKLDLLDKRILFHLEQNARIPLTTLSKKVRASREMVNYRIKRLEENKVIKHYRTVINQKMFSGGAASLHLKILRKNESQFQKIIDFLKEYEFVNWLGEFCGNYDISVTLVYRDTTHLSKIVNEIKEIVGDDLISSSLLIYVDEIKYTRWGVLELNETDKEPLRKVSFQSEKENIKLDEKDIQILKELNKTSKIKNIELAKKTKLGEDAIRNRLKKLEKEKVILGYTSFLDAVQFGFESYFLTLNVKDSDPEEIENMKKIIESNPYIYYATKVIGEYNILIALYARNREHFYNIQTELRNKLSNILTEHEFQLLYKEHKEIYMPDSLLKPL